MNAEHASVSRWKKIVIPTKEEMRAAKEKGVELSSRTLREQRAKKATAVRSGAAKTAMPPTGSLTTTQIVSTLRAENFRLQRELKAARKGEADMLKRMQRILGIQGN